MYTELMVPVALGLLPVVIFLLMLLALDSYKLVRLRLLVVVIASGALAAALSWFVNGLISAQLDLPFAVLTRYVGPPVEELAKAAVIVVLLRTHRVGFLIDAAICGFAVGTGFAAVENLQYLQLVPNAGPGVWLLRGFGTAIMHGGAGAIFAMVTLAPLEPPARRPVRPPRPGLALAIVLHSAYNPFFLSPFASMVGILLVLPPLLFVVF